MLEDIKRRKSLAFYHASPATVFAGERMISNSVNSVLTANMVARVGKSVYIYDQEYHTIMDYLHIERNRLADKVAQGIKHDVSYQGARSDGVSLAWKYEKADVQMGGKGSANWNKAEQSEILTKGRVRGAEGHHQKNVAKHLEEQANPDNIKFYKTKEEHLQKGHGGKWDNETDAPLIDKNKMLKNTNQRRVIKQELCGLGKATALGLGIGFSLSFIAEAAKSDFSAEAMEEALVRGSIGGIESAAISAAGYGMGILTSNILQSVGVDLSSQAGQLLNGSAAGMLSIVLVSAYQLVNLQLEGNLDTDALGQIGYGAAYSVSVLAVSMIVQSWVGGAAGIIVSSAAGLVVYTVSVAKTLKERHMEKCLREYTIEQYRP